MDNDGSSTSQGTRAELEQALRAAQERNRIHFEQAPFSIQLLSPAGRTLSVNQAWKDLWGFPEEVVQDYILTQYDMLNDPQLVAKGIMPFIRKGFAGETTHIPPILYDPRELGFEGTPRWVSGFIYAVKDAAGRITEVVLNHADVTRAKTAEDELREAVRARDEFISICSHELKTPITSMKLQFQVAARKIAKGDASAWARENVQKRVSNGLRQLDRMARLIEQMLDVSRISAGRLELSREPLDLSELAREVIGQFSEQISALGVSIGLVAPSRAATVLGDRYRLEQVISNLVTNALKYGDGRPVQVSLQAEPDRVLLKVKDRGIGIPRESLGRIFDRFERAISATHISGLGLGLYISRQIIEAHQGRIWAESEPGEGATFCFEMPRA